MVQLGMLPLGSPATDPFPGGFAPQITCTSTDPEATRSGTRGCHEEEMVGLKNGWKQGSTVDRAKMSHMEITQKTPTENLTSNFPGKK